MSVLDELEIQEKCAAHILASDSDIDSGEEFKYSMYMDTLSECPKSDVHEAVAKLYAIFAASHYIFRYKIESVTISRNSVIQLEDIPTGIQIIESDFYQETYGPWPRFKVAVSFDFRTKFKEGRLTIDEDKVACERGVLRFMKQLAYVCASTIERRSQDVENMIKSSDYHITIKNNETSYTFDLDCADVSMLYKGLETDSEKLLRRMLYTMDRDTTSDLLESRYEIAVFKYQHRTKLWRLKRKNWETEVVLSPKIDFEAAYVLKIKGYGVADLYARYNVLRALCEFSEFNKLFYVDNSIYTTAELFWNMCPRRFREYHETYFNEKNFANISCANWFLKLSVDAYDKGGYDAVVKTLETEFNSTLLPQKLRVRLDLA